MSRSYRKTPVCGSTIARSDKPYKRILAKSRRSRERMDMYEVKMELVDPDDFVDARLKYDDRVSCKDGKQWFAVDPANEDEETREKYTKLLRK